MAARSRPRRRPSREISATGDVHTSLKPRASHHTSSQEPPASLVHLDPLWQLLLTTRGDAVAVMRTAVCVGLLAPPRGAVPALLFRNVIDKGARALQGRCGEDRRRRLASRRTDDRRALESHKWSSESGLKKGDEKDKWIIQLGDPKLQERKPYALRLQAMVQTQARHAAAPCCRRTPSARPPSSRRRQARAGGQATHIHGHRQGQDLPLRQRQYPRPPKQLDKDARSGHYLSPYPADGAAARRSVPEARTRRRITHMYDNQLARRAACGSEGRRRSSLSLSLSLGK